MKINNKINSLYIILGLGIFLFFVFKTVAIINPYQPGETSDPACARGDVNCTVDIEKDLYKENPTGTVINTTSGTNSIVVGSNSTASGDYSIAIGHGDGIENSGGTASGDYSIAIGMNSVSSGLNSIALQGLASGKFSTAIGEGSISSSFREISMGSYPTTYNPASVTTWDVSDRLFNIGYGSTSDARADAFTILKNGNIGIGNATPQYILEINSTDSIRIPSGTTADRPAEKATGLLRYNTETPGLEYSDGEDWFSVSTGSASFSLLDEAVSSPTNALATGQNSVAIGNFSTATASNSIAIGAGATTDYSNQIVLGSYPRLDGSSNNRLVIGVGNEDMRQNTLVMTPAGYFGFGDMLGREIVHPLEMSSGAHVTAAGVWTDASDQALKENVVDLSYGLDDVLELQPRSFNYIIDGSESIGFVAQEVEEVIPEVVSGTDGRKGVAYGQLTAVLVNAVQELEARVVALEDDAGIKPVEEEVIPEEDVTPEEPVVEPETPDQAASVISTGFGNNLTTNTTLLIVTIVLLGINLIMMFSYHHKEK